MSTTSNVSMSMGLRTMLLGGEGLAQVMNYGVIELYHGSRPATPDEAVSGVRVGIVSNYGSLFSPGNIDGGLLVDGSTPGLLTDNGNWYIRGLRSGVVDWWRWRWLWQDHRGLSYSLPRIDGDAGDSLVMESYDITSSTFVKLDSFRIGFVGE